MAPIDYMNHVKLYPIRVWDLQPGMCRSTLGPHQVRQQRGCQHRACGVFTR